MITPKFTIWIEKGKIKFQDRQQFDNYIAGLKDNYYQMIVKRPEKIRTSQQNKYYHGVVIKMISDYTGYTTNQVHEGLKHEFLLKDNKFGLEVATSTKKLEFELFWDYIENVREWAKETLSTEENQFIIPEPDPEWKKLKTRIQGYKKNTILDPEK